MKGSTKLAVDTFGAKAVALDALYSILNVEGAALTGRELGLTWKGLDVPYHFDKVREAIKALEAK